MTIITKWHDAGFCVEAEQKPIDIQLERGSELISAWGAESKNGEAHIGDAIFYTNSVAMDQQSYNVRVQISHSGKGKLQSLVCVTYFKP